MADAADPFVMTDGLTYLVFSTSAQWLNVPVAVVPAQSLVPLGGGLPGYGLAGPPARSDGTVARIDAMPQAPTWAAPDGVWAPSVARFGGRYVMYFAATRPDPPDPVNPQCVGRAFADTATGPYVPETKPFYCGLQGVHGALDPSVVRTPTGAAFLLIAAGGTSTTLWSIPLDGSGGAAGSPIPLLRLQQPWESWFLENPSMIYDGSDYLLAYSAGNWKLPSYATGLAHCASPTGPCRSNPTGPWLSTAGDISGPGGLSFFLDIDGHPMAAFHAYRRGQEGLFGVRSLFIRRVTLTTKSIALTDSSADPRMTVTTSAPPQVTTASSTPTSTSTQSTSSTSFGTTVPTVSTIRGFSTTSTTTPD